MERTCLPKNVIAELFPSVILTKFMESFVVSLVLLNSKFTGLVVFSFLKASNSLYFKVDGFGMREIFINHRNE